MSVRDLSVPAQAAFCLVLLFAAAVQALPPDHFLTVDPDSLVVQIASSVADDVSDNVPSQAEVRDGTPLPAVITSNMLLSAAGSPYIAQGDVTIQPGVTVTVSAGVEIRMPDDACIFVEGYLNVYGTESDPVYFMPDLDATRWGALVYFYASGPSVLRHAIIEHASSATDPDWGPAALSIMRTDLSVENCTLRNNIFCVVSYDADVHISGCDFPAGSADELVNLQLGTCVVENSRFYDAQNNGDAVDFDGVTNGVIRNNYFEGGTDDAIDLGIGGGIGANVIIEDNFITGMGDNGVGVGENSTGHLARNIFINCTTGVVVKDNSTAFIDHCSFYGNDVAVDVYENYAGWGGGFAYVGNCILSESGTTLRVDELSLAEVDHSCSDRELLEGPGNLFDNPEFVGPAGGDLALQPTSPCINAGDPADPPDPDGSRNDMGAIFFDLGSQELVINEINYNSALDFDPGDWVEFHNPSNLAVNLSGMKFKDDDDLHVFQFADGTTIAPGGYLVLCSDLTAFQSRFPWVLNAIGNMNFGLNGTGELIRLYSATNILVDAVNYDDAPPWPVEPDGGGPTLELISSLLDNMLPTSWAASLSHGTPGVVNSASSPTDADQDAGQLPAAPVLMPLYPNPFNPRTTIPFALDRGQRVRLAIYDLEGRCIAVLADRHFEAGMHTQAWTGCDAQGRRVSSGVYFVRMETESAAQGRKLLLLK